MAFWMFSRLVAGDAPGKDRGKPWTHKPRSSLDRHTSLTAQPAAGHGVGLANGELPDPKVLRNKANRQLPEETQEAWEEGTWPGLGHSMDLLGE